MQFLGIQNSGQSKRWGQKMTQRFDKQLDIIEHHHRFQKDATPTILADFQEPADSAQYAYMWFYGSNMHSEEVPAFLITFLGADEYQKCTVFVFLSICQVTALLLNSVHLCLHSHSLKDTMHKRSKITVGVCGLVMTFFLPELSSTRGSHSTCSWLLARNHSSCEPVV